MRWREIQTLYILIGNTLFGKSYSITAHKIENIMSKAMLYFIVDPQGRNVLDVYIYIILCELHTRSFTYNLGQDNHNVRII